MSSDQAKRTLEADKNSQSSLEEQAAKSKTTMDTFLERYPGQPWVVAGLTRGGNGLEHADTLVPVLQASLTETIKSIATSKSKQTDKKTNPASQE